MNSLRVVRPDPTLNASSHKYGNTTLPNPILVIIIQH